MSVYVLIISLAVAGVGYLIRFYSFPLSYLFSPLLMMMFGVVDQYDRLKCSVESAVV